MVSSTYIGVGAEQAQPSRFSVESMRTSRIVVDGIINNRDLHQRIQNTNIPVVLEGEVLYDSRDNSVTNSQVIDPWLMPRASIISRETKGRINTLKNSTQTKKFQKGVKNDSISRTIYGSEEQFKQQPYKQQQQQQQIKASRLSNSNEIFNSLMEEDKSKNEIFQKKKSQNSMQGGRNSGHINGPAQSGYLKSSINSVFERELGQNSSINKFLPSDQIDFTASNPKISQEIIQSRQKIDLSNSKAATNQEERSQKDTMHMINQMKYAPFNKNGGRPSQHQPSGALSVVSDRQSGRSSSVRLMNSSKDTFGGGSKAGKSGKGKKLGGGSRKNDKKGKIGNKRKRKRRKRDNLLLGIQVQQRTTTTTEMTATAKINKPRTTKSSRRKAQSVRKSRSNSFQTPFVFEKLYEQGRMRSQAQNMASQEQKQAKQVSELKDCTFKPELISEKKRNGLSRLSFMDRQNVWLQTKRHRAFELAETMDRDGFAECTFKPDTYESQKKLHRSARRRVRGKKKAFRSSKPSISNMELDETYNKQLQWYLNVQMRNQLIQDKMAEVPKFKARKYHKTASSFNKNLSNKARNTTSDMEGDFLESSVSKIYSFNVNLKHELGKGNQKRNFVLKDLQNDVEETQQLFERLGKIL